MNLVLDNKGMYNAATASAHLLNYLPSFVINNGLNPWAYAHKMMKFLSNLSIRSLKARMRVTNKKG